VTKSNDTQHSKTGAKTGVAAGSKRPALPRIEGKRATIYDLARIANVSPGTVSRVLNNRDRVKTETREAVLRAAAELNLKPQASVRNREVAILSEPTYPDRFSGYAGTLTAHLSFALAQRNIGVLLPVNPLAELPTKFIDGIIVVTEAKALRELVTELEKRMPVVHIDKFQLVEDEYVVCSDHYSAGYVAARHFIERGKRRPAFIGGDHLAFAERLKGFKKALTEADIQVDERCASLYGPESNYASVVTRVVRAGADSIYVPGSSYEALECLHILAYVMGLKVPQEISIIGGENDRVSSLLNPPMTTIEEPLREMAEQAAAMIDKLTTGLRVVERRVMLPIRLVERNSLL
jgi:LacI family transcriptional regulator